MEREIERNEMMVVVMYRGADHFPWDALGYLIPCNRCVNLTKLKPVKSSPHVDGVHVHDMSWHKASVMYTGVGWVLSHMSFSSTILFLFIHCGKVNMATLMKKNI